ncbi:response regulator [Achromobacter xylosoxidans]
MISLTEEERAWIAEHPVISVGVRADIQPLEYISNGEIRGLAGEYLKAVSRLTGLRYQVKAESGKTISQLGWLEDGTVDLFPLAIRNIGPLAESKEILFTSPYYVTSTIIVAPSGGPTLIDLGELNGYTVALSQYSRFENHLREVVPNVRVVIGEGAEGTLELVATGKADVAIGLDGFLSPLLSGRYANILQISGVISSSAAELSMAVSRRQPILRAILQKALQEITADEARRMNSAWLAQANFGTPSLRVLVRHYGPQGLLLAGSVFVLAGLANIWRIEHRRAINSEREKAMFLAVTSHEVRSPMNAVLASVELLQRTPLTEDQHHLLKLASDAGATLLRLLDNVLDLSKLEAGQFTPKLEPTDIAHLADVIVEFYRVQTQKKGIELIASTRPICGRLMLDPNCMEQILHTLISNAVKFTDTGTITIAISFSPNGLAPELVGGSLSVVVADTGVGMDAQTQTTLFNRHMRSDTTTKSTNGGMGLSLAIFHRLIQSLGGSATLHSAPHVGTTWTVTLPAPAGPDYYTVLNQRSTPRASAQHAPPNILLVEDTPANQYVIQAQLARLGCSVRLAVDGTQACSAFDQEPFDVVLMDCDLPDTDGYTLARRFRIHESRSGRTTCAIIAISALTGSDHASRCLEAGMDGVLSKPIRLEKLRSTIETWCTVTPQGYQSSFSKADIAPSMGTAEALQASFEADLNMLEAAMIARDFHRARHYAHRLRGASLSLGWSLLARLATGLEELLEAGVRVDTEDAFQVLEDAKLEIRRIFGMPI